MRSYDAAEIRNVAVIGHGDAGKTSVVSALLFDSGAVNRLGKVDEGNTITDFDEESIERKKSISAALCHLEWEKCKINLIDTPGYRAFLHETRGALPAVETALITLSAVAGVEVGTRKVWKFCDEFRVARMFVVNKMDRERASFERSVQSIQDAFGRTAVPLQIPVGEEKNFRGVVDLIRMKALTWSGEDGTPSEEDVPADLKEAAASAREALVDMIAEADDALMEKFLEAGSLTDEELRNGLKKAVHSGGIYPIFCAAATLNAGFQPILDALVHYAPSPADAGGRAARDAQDAEVIRRADHDEPFSAFVFKSLIDAFSGKISYFRVVSGAIRSDATIFNAARGDTERVGHLNIVQGKAIQAVEELRAGDLGAFAKLKITQTGDTLVADKNHVVEFPRVEFPDPPISWAIEPKSRGDEEKLSAGLHKLLDADPMLRVSRDPQTKEMLISGSGQQHVEVALSRLKRQGVECTLKLPKIPYRETVTKPVKYVEYTHKKQTGGAGQFARVFIDLEPKKDGGYEFVDKIVGGVIDQSFRPSVDKGIQAKMQDGVLAGFPVTGVRVSLVDGKTHPVDSKDIAFQIAGREAFKKAFMDAGPALLEPHMHVEVTVPEECYGDVLGDLNSRRGRVQGMDSAGGNSVIKAIVPMAEMLSYNATLNSLTGGRGEYAMELDHYDQVPPHLQEKIISEAKAAAGKAEAED